MSASPYEGSKRHWEERDAATLRRVTRERAALLQALIDLKREALPYIWESPAFKAAHDVLVSIGK